MMKIIFKQQRNNKSCQHKNPSDYMVNRERFIQYDYGKYSGKYRLKQCKYWNCGRINISEGIINWKVSSNLCDQAQAQ